MAVAQLTALHLSILSAGTTLTGQPELPDDQSRLDSVGRVSPIPKRKSRNALATVSFQRFPEGRSRSFPTRYESQFALPASQSDGLVSVPVAITIAAPAYALFPFDEPFEEEDMWTTPRFPSLPPGFGSIGSSGLLPDTHPTGQVSSLTESVNIPTWRATTGRRDGTDTERIFVCVVPRQGRLWWVVTDVNDSRGTSG